jgi:DNA-directed RNA polymerase specialized sigma24 family protein
MRSPTLRPTLVWIAFSDDSPRARAALSILYKTYRKPVEAYIRRWRFAGRYDAERAEELTQEFFVRQVAKRDLVKNWDPERTRFRTWLFAAVRHFLLNELDRRARERLHVSFDDALHEPSDSRTPERELADEWARDWAKALIDEAFVALRRAYAAGDRERLARHDALVPYLGLAMSKREEPPYADLSERLGRLPVTLRGDMRKMRGVWKEAVCHVVRQTVPADEVVSELRFLVSVLEGRDRELPIPPKLHPRILRTSRIEPQLPEQIQ